VFKPIGASYSAGLNGRVVKKLKAEDGKARTMATAKGIADKHILKNDTILCPVSQFSFSAATIKKKFGGNNEFLLDGVVTNVTHDTINIKFAGDTHVSPYPLAGFGQFVARRQYKAVATNFYGTVLVEERIVNQLERGGWMEGDLLDVAMSMEDCTQPMKVVVSASVYCLISSGNAELFKKYTEHLDNEFQQLMLFPVQAAQHWSLLTYQPGIARLCACDSGVGKMFAHSDEHYAPFITAIELAVGVDAGTLSKNPLRLNVSVQPNALDCGFHVVLNARSLTKYMLDRDEDAPVANLKDDWQPPPSTLPEVRQYRKHLVQHLTALPFGVASASQASTERCFSS
jgi:hypothetical protein